MSRRDPRTVGRALAFHPREPEGLVAELQIARTELGDETLAWRPRTASTPRPASSRCRTASSGRGATASDSQSVASPHRPDAQPGIRERQRPRGARRVGL